MLGRNVVPTTYHWVAITDEVSELVDESTLDGKFGLDVIEL